MSHAYCLQKRVNTFGLLLFLLFCAVYVFYFYVRIAHTLQTGFLGYSIFVLVIEFISSTNMVRLSLHYQACRRCML